MKSPAPRFFKEMAHFTTVVRCILGVGCCLLLSNCAHRHPVQGVARSSRPYYLHGKWHYPQRHYDYNEVGLASWYGPSFHLSLKAQGEPYNQHTMSAAHKTLPLPTVVRVTNLENGKSVVILVDDRGPYKYKNRIIDLSMSAAKALGFHKQGVSKVRVTSLPKESHAFSMYLAQKGTKDRHGRKRTWDEIYRQEIGLRRGYAQLTDVPHSERQAFHEAQRHIQKAKTEPNSTKRQHERTRDHVKFPKRKSMSSVEKYLRERKNVTNKERR